MPQRRLPDLPIQRTPMVGGRKCLNAAETAARDAALLALREATSDVELATARLLAAVADALEKQATYRLVGETVGMTEQACMQWVRRSRRRDRDDLAENVVDARPAGRGWLSL